MSWKRSDVYGRMSTFLDHLPEHIDGYILDLGTGDGVFASLLAKRYGSSTIIQSDLNNFTLQTDLGHYAAIERLSYRPTSIDLMVAAQVLHYIPGSRLNSVLDRLASLLVNDGLLVVVEYRTDRSYGWLPYPIPLEKIKSYDESQDQLQLISLIADKDRRRPKYGAYFQRVI